MCSVNCVLVLIFCVYIFVNGDHFGYSSNDQQLWAIHHPQCGGIRQSPIDISTHLTTPALIRPLRLIGYNEILPYPMKMQNNGHTVDIVASDPISITPYVTGGPLKGVYQLQMLHFHWGEKNYKGSEHSISGRKYSLELHLVHRNVKYNAEEARDYEKGLLVMALLFEVSLYDNEHLYPITRHLNQIWNVNASAPILAPFSARQLMAGVNAGKYYTYRGSLTTPPCSESVTWIVFADILKISPNQLKEFRQLKSSVGGKITKNHRFVQPWNGRQVYVRIDPKRYI